MDTGIITSALNAAGQQAATWGLLLATSAVVLSTIAWLVASLAAGKARTSR